MPFLDFLQVEPARVPRYAAFFVLGIPARRGDRLAGSPHGPAGPGCGSGSPVFAVGPDASFFGAGGANGASLL
ncbi:MULTISPECIES: hypothetical protein [unclassified Streptomyces]|uniref:hypothetical protein n=1 Tax=unclassified Streptomyces TaxID=2593676 RepID=UPI00382E7C92